MQEFIDLFGGLLNYLDFIPSSVLVFVGSCLAFLVVVAIRRFIS